MAVLYIEEFQALAADPTTLRALSIPQQPAIATQTVAIGAGSVQSNRFGATTKYVRITSDVACSYLFGASPTATAASPRLPANGDRLYGVVGGNRLAVITNT